VRETSSGDAPNPGDPLAWRKCGPAMVMDGVNGVGDVRYSGFA